MAYEAAANDSELLHQQLLQSIWDNVGQAIKLDGMSLGSTDTATLDPRLITDDDGRPLAHIGPSVGIWRVVGGGYLCQDGSVALGCVGVFQHNDEVETTYSGHSSIEWYDFERTTDGALTVERTFTDNHEHSFGRRQEARSLAESLGMNHPSNDELTELNSLLTEKVQALATKRALERRQQRAARIRGIGRTVTRLLRFEVRR